MKPGMPALVSHFSVASPSEFGVHAEAVNGGLIAEQLRRSA